LLGHPQRIVAFGLGSVVLANGVGMTLDAEASEKIDALDVHALVHDYLGGEHGIEAARNQGDGFAGLCHGNADRVAGALILDLMECEGNHDVYRESMAPCLKSPRQRTAGARGERALRQCPHIGGITG
jgi:hypothetical protein